MGFSRHFDDNLWDFLDHYVENATENSEYMERKIDLFINDQSAKSQKETDAPGRLHVEFIGRETSQFTALSSKLYSIISEKGDIKSALRGLIRADGILEPEQLFKSILAETEMINNEKSILSVKDYNKIDHKNIGFKKDNFGSIVSYVFAKTQFLEQVLYFKRLLINDVETKPFLDCEEESENIEMPPIIFV